jgi:hypothetical protein
MFVPTLLSGAFLFAQTPVPTCTVTNIRGVPVSGTICGGSALFGSRSCTAGALYTCKAGALGTMNNCKLVQACANGCLQSEDTGKGACFTGAAPFTVSPLNTAGGNDVNLNVNLAAPHSGAIINLEIDRGDIVPGTFCAVPDFPSNASSVHFALNTSVVSQTTPVKFFIELPYNDPAGANGFEIISTPQVLTLTPGGTEPPAPPIASFVLDPTSIGPAGIGFAEVSLAGKAPASGVQIHLTSSDPEIASIIQAGQPFVMGNCTDGSVAEAIQAALAVPQQTVVDISASSGAAGQAPLIQPLTVTSGCVPVACSGGPSCGPQPNGCGGTMNCGCADPNQTCGGGGIANQCGTAVVSVSSLTMSPTSIVGGSTSTGTVRLSPPAPAGGTSVVLSSNSPFVTVPASVAFSSGATVATFTANTTRVQAGTVTATISATLHTTASADLTLTPTAACVPTTCSALGKICGTAPDGCGGTLTCGSACGSSSAVITLVATGKGQKVTSTPAGLNVSSGNSGSAAFTVGSPLTLKTDDGHGAIWSGLCSSGGQATPSCTFIVAAAGTVTSNAQ